MSCWPLSLAHSFGLVSSSLSLIIRAFFAQIPTRHSFNVRRTGTNGCQFNDDNKNHLPLFLLYVGQGAFFARRNHSSIARIAIAVRQIPQSSGSCRSFALTAGCGRRRKAAAAAQSQSGIEEEGEVGEMAMSNPQPARGRWAQRGGPVCRDARYLLLASDTTQDPDLIS